MKFVDSQRLSNKNAIYFSLTSMIGAGIFIKTQTLNSLSNSQVGPLVCLFLIFLINIFAFCHVLLKIIPHQTGNMGFIEWSKEFCPPWLNSIFCNFTRHFYHPISLFLFSVYGVVGITGGRYIGIGVTMILAFILICVLMSISFVSFKLSKTIQMWLLGLVFIPIVFLPIIGIIHPGYKSISDENPIRSQSPWFLLIAGIPSILFIYDGFYNVTSLRNKLKNPNALKNIVVVSIALVTLIYLYVIIGFNVGDPDHGNYKNFLFLEDRVVLKDAFEILISTSSLLTLNSIVVSSMPQLISMYNSQKFRDVEALKNMIFYKRSRSQNPNFETKFTIWFYLMLKTLACFIIVGSLMIISSRYNSDPIEIMDSLADMISVLVFMILVSTILGSLKKYKNEKNFKVWALICSSIIFIALIYLVSNYIGDTQNPALSKRITGWIKLSALVLFLVGSSSWQVFDFVDKRLNRRKNLLYSYYHRNDLSSLR